MKIAIPTSGHQIDSHFGHCEKFTIVTVDENNEIISKEELTPPRGCGCKTSIIPSLSQLGVTAMLAGNMGEGAVVKLNQFGIRVVRGCAGDVDAAVKSWLSGSLTDSGSSCAEHGGDCSH